MALNFISENKEKYLEIKEIIPQIKMISLQLPEIQEIDPKAIIEGKLKFAMKKQKGELFCEDTSLYINCLNGFPGPLIKWILKSLTDKGLAELVLK